MWVEKEPLLQQQVLQRHNANQELIKQISLQASLKRVIKERIGVSFMKFKNLPRD